MLEAEKLLFNFILWTNFYLNQPLVCITRLSISKILFVCFWFYLETLLALNWSDDVHFIAGKWSKIKVWLAQLWGEESKIIPHICHFFTQTPKFLPKFFHLKELKSAAKAASRQNSIYKLIPRSSNSHIYLIYVKAVSFTSPLKNFTLVDWLGEGLETPVSENSIKGGGGPGGYPLFHERFFLKGGIIIIRKYCYKLPICSIMANLF